MWGLLGSPEGLILNGEILISSEEGDKGEDSRESALQGLAESVGSSNEGQDGIGGGA